MKSALLDECIIWDPEGRQPKKPEAFKSFIPLYPVYFTRISPKALGRGWFWVYHCVVCGNERLMSSGSIIYDECTCPKNIRRSIFHKDTETICSYCSEPFVYTQTSNAHITKYCSPECTSLGRKKLLNEWIVKNRELEHIHTFDRVTICMRRNKRKHFELCDKYHECQDHRVNGELGPHYVESNTCYSYSGINTI